jgi:arabinofuranosyltransferase
MVDRPPQPPAAASSSNTRQGFRQAIRLHSRRGIRQSILRTAPRCRRHSTGDLASSPKCCSALLLWSNAATLGSVETGAAAQDRWATFAAGTALLLVFSALFAHWNLLADDAFISFRYARNLAASGELWYNPGDWVEGYSSLVWTLLLAGFHALGADIPAAAQSLGYGLAIGTLGATYLIARRTLGLSSVAAAFAVAMLASSVSWTYWANSGMESVLFSLLVLWLYSGLFSRLAMRSYGPAVLALLATTLALTRPEGIVVALGLFAALLALRRGRRWPALSAAALLVVLLGAHLLWRYETYGALLPNPAYAKLSLTPESWMRGARYLWEYLYTESVLFLLPLAVLAWPKGVRALILAGIVLGYAVIVVLVGGDGLYRYRWPAHILPCLVLLFAAGLDRLWRERRRWCWAIVPLSGVLALLPLTAQGFFREHTLAEVRGWEQRWRLVGHALRKHATAGQLLATNVAGRVPYYSELPTLDLLGLTDRFIARQPAVLLGSGYAGHERAAPRYVLGRRPALVYISVLDGLPPQAFRSLRLSRAILAAGSLFRYAPLLDSAQFERDYTPAQLRLADGRDANLFIRTDLSAAFAARPGIEVQSWLDAKTE